MTQSNKNAEKETVWKALGISEEQGRKMTMAAAAVCITAETVSDALETIFPKATNEERARIYAYTVAFAGLQQAEAMASAAMRGLRGRDE